MRIDHDSMHEKMDSMLETMLFLAQKEKDVETNAEVRRVVAQFGSSSFIIPGVINLEGNFIRPEGAPIHIPLVNDNTLNYSSASARHRSVTDEEDWYDASFIPQPIKPIVETFLDPVVERLLTLLEKFKSLEVLTTTDLDVVDMCLVPGLVIPWKFKLSDFHKYKGISCHRTHLRSYRCKMEAHINNDQLLIHYFQVSLSEASFEWYMQLERG